MNVDGEPHVWLILGFGWQAADEGKHPWTENSSRKLKISAARLILSREDGVRRTELGEAALSQW